ncbi:MAG TPA: glutamate 5-kinase [Candidatus Eisenbacteria bacterium]|nr:glutamate 5-kinase [Candidatus Eisenbacteria bacterium]
MKSESEAQPRIEARRNVAQARRIVVKVGTNVVMRDDGRLALSRLYGIAESVARLRLEGRDVLMVSSGAVGLGMERIGLTARPTELARIQACAAIGQSRLMAIYDDAFDKLGCRTAQVLLTEDDFLDPVRYGNLRSTLVALLAMGVIPVINENDTVSTAELDHPTDSPERLRVFGDNDKLSALVMTHIDADLLLLLSDVDGLYTAEPSNDGAQLVSEVSAITPEVLEFAQGKNGRGRGGMSSKLEAVRIATDAGGLAVIANGRLPHVIERVCGGEVVGTLFLARGHK